MITYDEEKRMYQDISDTDLDFRKIMKSVAQLNPHISMSDIAFLMDMPYEAEPGEIDAIDQTEAMLMAS